jgi:ankyrin repeat protein
MDLAEQLYIASWHGNKDEVLRLLDQNADINSKHLGHAPLHWAAGKGHLAVVRLLIDRHANVNVLSDMHWTPLHHACYYSHEEVARELLNRGADVDPATTFKQTPLHLAAQHGNEAIALMLIDAGANVTLQDVCLLRSTLNVLVSIHLTSLVVGVVDRNMARHQSMQAKHIDSLN